MNVMSLSKQVMMDFKRGFLRNISFLFFTICMPIGFYLLFTKVFDMNLSGAAAEKYQVAVLMNMTTYSVLISSIYSIGMLLLEDSTNGVRRLAKLSPLTDIEYYGSKIILQLGLNILLIISVFVTGIVANGVELPFINWLLSGAWILFASLPIIAIGSLLVLCKNTNTASVLANLITFPLAIAGGLWWPIENFPKGVQVISKLLPSYYGSKGSQEMALGEIPDAKFFLIILFYFILFMVLSVYLIRKKEARN